MSAPLGESEIHIWAAGLDRADPEVAWLYTTLSADERDRIAGLYFARDQRRTIVCRGVLRSILSRYLDIPPSELRFAYGPHGKPELAASAGACSIAFNVSHSADIGLIAVTQGASVGIDVEQRRSLDDLAGLSGQILSTVESARFHALPRTEQRTAFWIWWTSKEAYLKATGQGLSCLPDQVAVSFDPPHPPLLLSVGGDPAEAQRWSLYTFAPGDRYTAAVVTRGHGWTRRFFQWS